MILYILAGIFALLTIIAFIYPNPYLPKTVFILYSLTSLVMGLLLYSHFKIVFILRYFFYVITGFMMSFVPLLLLLMALLIAMRMRQEIHISKTRIALNIFIMINLIALAGFTVWGSLKFDVVRLNILIDVYSMISMYFAVNFLMFICINGLIHSLPKSKPAKTIIVLGYDLDKDGNVTKPLKKRLDRVINLYFQQEKEYNVKSQIIVTGGEDPHSGLSEASAMKYYLVKKGIPEEQVVEEAYALNTDQNIQLSYEIVRREHLYQPLLIVTSRFHLMRTVLLTERLNIKADFAGSVSVFTIWPYQIVREYIAYLTLIKEWNYLFLFILVLITII